MACADPTTRFSAAISLSTTSITSTAFGQPIRIKRDERQLEGEASFNEGRWLQPRQRTSSTQNEGSQTDSTSRRRPKGSTTPTPSRTRSSSGTLRTSSSATPILGTQSSGSVTRTSSITRSTSVTSATVITRISVIPIVQTFTIQVPVETIPGSCTPTVTPSALSESPYTSVLITSTITHSDGSVETFTTLVPTQLPNTYEAKPSARLQPGAVAGIAIGCIVIFIVLVSLIVLFCVRKRKRRYQHRLNSNPIPRRPFEDEVDQNPFQFPMAYRDVAAPHPYTYDYGPVGQPHSPTSSISSSSSVHNPYNLGNTPRTDAEVAALRAIRSSGSQSGSIFREDFNSGRECLPNPSLDDMSSTGLGNRRGSYITDNSRGASRLGRSSFDQQIASGMEPSITTDFGTGNQYHHPRYGTTSTSGADLLPNNPSPTMNRYTLFGGSTPSLAGARFKDPPSSYYFIENPMVKERRSWSAPSATHPAGMRSSSSTSLPFVLRTSRRWSDGENDGIPPVAVRDLISSDDPSEAPRLSSSMPRRDSYILPQLPDDISGTGRLGDIPVELLPIDTDITIPQMQDSPVSDEQLPW